MPFNLKKLVSCPLTKSRTSDKDKNRQGSNIQDDEALQLIGADYLEDPDLASMRKTVEKNPEVFVLNNLMMCVQFFQNFDEEIHEIRQSLRSARELQYNANLLPHKRALLPDVLQEHVGKHLKFTSARQTLRPTVEPLQPLRMYVVHENYEIAEQNDPHHYTTMSDAVTYNLWLKPADHKGYVHLQHLGAIPVKRNPTTQEELRVAASGAVDEIYEKYIYSAKTEGEKKPPLAKSYSTRSLPEMLTQGLDCTEPRKSLYHSSREIKLESLYSEKSAPRVVESRKQSQRLQRNLTAKSRFTNDSPPSSTSSGYVTSGIDSESDYGYSGSSSVTDLAKNAELPSSCFKMITYTQSGKVYDPREDRRQNLTSKQKRIKDELRRYNYNVWYINSANFMRHFFKLFKQHLAEYLGFDEAAVSDAKCFGSVIYCDKIDVFGSSLYTKLEPFEIIPSVWSQWPECAEEWLVRERSVWPDFEAVQKVKEFGCYIVPESYVPRQESNPLRKIEWQLTFPAAERYLETCLDHAQARILLISLMLHKTFVRPVDTLLGLSTAHIRNKLFWLIEQSGSSSWPEHRTGECLLKLFSAIYQSISQNTPLMRDFFMKDKNLFQNIPNECLLQSQKQIHRILTNPIMYLIYAMENIHCKQSFFPRLDFDELLRILTADIVSLVNPQLVQANRNKLNASEHSNNSSSVWEEYRRNHYANVPRKTVTKTLINTRTINKNPIIEISVRCAEMDDIRLSILLDFFIRHFIQTAQRYHQYGAWKQKALYACHAERLCILLAEREGAQGNARVYMQKIKILKNLRIRLQTFKDAPETPKRNSDQPFFSRPLMDRFVQNDLENSAESTQAQVTADQWTTSDTIQLRSPRRNQSTDSLKVEPSTSCEVTRV